MIKVLLGLGFVLVVALAMVAGAFIYTTWFDNRQEIEAHIVADEDMPNMTKEDVEALAYTHFYTLVTARNQGFLLCLAGADFSDGDMDSIRYIGAGTWMVKAGACALTVDDRTGKVSP